ncbi:WD40-like Beta Propeller Repeat [Desulfatibacillum alkenivorans DSM 16219]|uniref:WD40-like Beta Propeller Repeat n=1 Tax=Desulfatibacillum alkenivorans DSM 16219 TaxID=1121393 RepID=A0A1M6KN42_9BACT|nr:PD40 domain-containing protein [Desulfatibacillum alkenivorans]SHJ60330.1 WD40-like Beta Propeller Repeat [Desulfatibacillum alkenivorans DSM 16219]
MKKRERKNALTKAIVIILILFPISVWAADYSEDWGLDGAVTDTEGLVVNILELSTEYYSAYPGWGNWNWSSDGSKIVYQVDDSNLSNSSEICVIKADGTGYTRLTDNDRCDSHASFVWPNNSKVVFQRNVASSGNGEIWIMDADGSNQTSLTQAHGGPMGGVDAGENNPMVSPDGTKVAFRGCVPASDGYAHLFVMDIDGANVKDVAAYNDGIVDISHHCWSPDSKWVCFKACDESVGDARIFKVKADGTAAPVKLSPADDAMPAAWNDWFCQNWPRWSPDGKWISTSLYTGENYNDKKIVIMDSNGQNMKTIMEQDGDDDGDNYDWIHQSGTWSPDSKWLVYSMDTVAEGDTALCISNVDSGAFYQLTKDYEDCQPRWSPNPKSKPGSILFKRHSVGDGLFLLNLAPWALDEISASGRTDFKDCGSTSWSQAGICLDVDLGAGGEEPIFIGALYDGNPTPQDFDGTFWDLYCPDPTNVVSVTLGLYFNGYHSGMDVYWFDEDLNNWDALDPLLYEVTEGLYLRSGITYTAVISMTITTVTTPSLDQLTGTVFAAGSVPEDETENIWAGKDSDSVLMCFVKSLDGRKTRVAPYALLFLGSAMGFAFLYRRASRK